MYDIPEGMLGYMRHYGRHFNKRMYEFAVSLMRDRNGKRAKLYTKEDLDAAMANYGLKLENDVMCDGLYVMSMAASDFLGSSLPNEQYLAMYVKDYIDDPDQVDGFVFNRFYADCVLKGIPIEWEDML